MKDTLTEAVKAVPPVSLSGLSLWGIPLPEWLTILGILYTLFLIIDKLPSVIRRFKQFADWLKGVKHEQSE